ncbi:hypothetical protein MBLNU230_g4310t1 [Neophaeotheca triangularis]
MAPCILVFEDLDSLVTDKVRSYFLNEVDGLEENDGVLMLGSINYLDRLGSSIAKRPSRFDRKYHYKLPSVKERLLYVQYWKRKLVAKPNLDFSHELYGVIARLSEGFSFAYLKELFVQCLLSIVSGRSGFDEMEDRKQGSKNLQTVAAEAEVGEGSTKHVAQYENVVSYNPAEEEAQTSVSRDAVDLPAVEISEALGKNPFFQILREQIGALVKEMDIYESGGGEGKKDEVVTGDDEGVVTAQRRTVARQRHLIEGLKWS